MSDQISDSRKGMYYLGMGLSILGGVLCFGSLAMGGCGVTSGHTMHPGAVFGPFILGMALMAVGGMLTKVGARGLAGSGVILDPEQAREDVKPWARMGGGVLKDALDEAGLNKAAAMPEAPFDLDAELRKLEKLRADGLLSEAEYAAAKQRCLDRYLK